MISRYPARAILLILAATGVGAGFILAASGSTGWQQNAWIGTSFIVLSALTAQIIDALRRREFGLDILAFVSMVAALGVGEYLAAAVVALMYAGGQFLEAFADRRARREMTALLSRTPRTALRVADGCTEEVAVEDLREHDHVLVRQGDAVPADGVVVEGVALLDESGLTGEALPARRHIGDAVMSGGNNVSSSFTMRLSRSAADSTLAGIVRLVETAQRSRPPMARFADRFAVLFMVLTACAAGIAWSISGDAIRIVAVLVIATPCPLILAVPIAFIAGLSRAARHGILLKGSEVIEALTKVDRLVLDKTGTLTDGQARVIGIEANGVPPEEVLRLAASLDQASTHMVARTIVDEARHRGIRLDLPVDVVESAGEGIAGTVGNRKVLAGGPRFLSRHLRTGVPAQSSGSLVVSVAADGEPVGNILLADRLRAEAGGVLDQLRRRGMHRIILATGDRKDVAVAVARDLKLDRVCAGLTPAQKAELVHAEAAGGTVMMIGDGVNDAPALAAARVGVAMGARGAAAASEAAGVVLLVDRLDRIAIALDIAVRSRAIALQCAAIGTSLSVVGMAAAALGYLTPVQGALLQELIDIAAIGNALRALQDPRASVDVNARDR